MRVVLGFRNQMRSASERGEMILLCSVTGARSEILMGKGMPEDGGETKGRRRISLRNCWGVREGMVSMIIEVSLT